MIHSHYGFSQVSDAAGKTRKRLSNAEGVEASSPALRVRALRWGGEVTDVTTPSGLRPMIRLSPRLARFARKPGLND